MLNYVRNIRSSKVSLGDVAKAAGVSKATASLVLRNNVGPSKETREHVLRIAKQLRYVPDARIASWMAKVQDAQSKDLLPIAWLNTGDEKDAWRRYKFLTPYMEGAVERSLQLGYRLEEVWTRQPGMTMRRISQILYQRRIEGVIVTYPARHLHLEWDHLACVALGGALLAPRMHRVTIDSYFNLLLALKTLRRYGYRRIGICLAEQVDRFSHRVLRSTTRDFVETSPKENQIPPLFYAGEDTIMFPEAQRQVVAWVHRYRPEVIVGSTSHLLTWVKSAGLRVPHDVGVIHLAVDDDVLDWAGIHSNKKEQGATAADWVISRLKNRQFGVAETAMNICIRGTWHNGRTLLVPKPK